VGLQPADFQVALIAAAPRTVPAANLTLLSTLLTDPTAFPSGDTAVAGNDIVVVGVYSFRTALVALFSSPSGGGDYGVIQLRATSRERIEF
jgi:hypothetical protein